MSDIDPQRDLTAAERRILVVLAEYDAPISIRDTAARCYPDDFTEQLLDRAEKSTQKTGIRMRRLRKLVLVDGRRDAATNQRLWTLTDQGRQVAAIVIATHDADRCRPLPDRIRAARDAVAVYATALRAQDLDWIEEARPVAIRAVRLIGGKDTPAWISAHEIAADIAHGAVTADEVERVATDLDRIATNLGATS